MQELAEQAARDSVIHYEDGGFSGNAYFELIGPQGIDLVRRLSDQFGQKGLEQFQEVYMPILERTLQNEFRNAQEMHEGLIGWMRRDPDDYARERGDEIMRRVVAEKRVFGSVLEDLGTGQPVTVIVPIGPTQEFIDYSKEGAPLEGTFPPKSRITLIFQKQPITPTA